MATPEPAAGSQPLPHVAAPTVRVQRPPGRPIEPVAGPPPRPSHPDDESTIGLPRPGPVARQRTIRFGTPAPVTVTVSARPRPRRRFRTWPWIVAVVVALLVVGAVLLVMLLQGDTVERRLEAPETAPGVARSADPEG